jgi:hypothetical protein
MKNTFAAIFALGLVWQATPLYAQNYEQAILAQLRQDGYEQITVTTTLLGRIRIVADGAQGQREIVLNPRPGEVLRDVLLLASLADDGGSRGGRSGGSGSSGNDDDDDNDDNDDNDDDSDDTDRDDKDDDANEDDDDDDGGKGRGGDDD